MTPAHFATLAAATVIAATAGHRFRWLLSASIFASALVAMAIVSRPSIFDEPQWLVFAAYTVSVKCLLLPRQLREVRTRRQTPPESRRSASTLAAACVLAVLGYATTATTPAADILGAALAIGLVGAFIAVSRTDPLARAIGLIVLANGFVLALVALPTPSAAAFMALVAIDLGVLGSALALRDPAVAAALADPGSVER